MPSSGETSEEIVRASSIKEKNIILGGDLNIIYPSKKILADFLALVISYGNIRKDLIKKVQGTSIAHLYNSDIKKTKVSIPEIKEQEKIIKIIKIINSIITLELDKKSSLTSLKAMLHQQIFGTSEKKSELFFNVPKTNWQSVPFKNIIKSSFKGTVKVKDLTSGVNQYLDANRLNGGEPFYCAQSPNVNKDNIIILWDGSRAGRIYSGFTGVLGSTMRAYELKEDVDSKYVYYYLKNKEKLIVHSYTTPNIPHVVRDFDEIFKISLPPLHEQIKIGKILMSIDKMIDMQENKINKYQLIKDMILFNVFV